MLGYYVDGRNLLHRRLIGSVNTFGKHAAITVEMFPLVKVTVTSV